MIIESVFSRPLIGFTVTLIVAGFLGLMVGEFGNRMMEEYKPKPTIPRGVSHEPSSES